MRYDNKNEFEKYRARKKTRSPQGGKLCRAAALGIAGAVFAVNPGMAAAGTVDYSAALKQKTGTAGSILQAVPYDSDQSETGTVSESSRDNWEEQSIIERWGIDPEDLPSEEQAEIPTVPEELQDYFRDAVAGTVDSYHGTVPPEADLQKYSFRADVLREAVRDKALTVLAAEKTRLLSGMSSSVQSLRDSAVMKLASGIRELNGEASQPGKQTGMQMILGSGSGNDADNNTENSSIKSESGTAGSTGSDSVFSEADEDRQKEDSAGKSSNGQTSADKGPFLSIFSGPAEDVVKTVPSANPSWTEAPAAKRSGLNPTAEYLSDPAESHVTDSSPGNEDFSGNAVLSGKTPDENSPEDIAAPALFRGSFLLPAPPGFSSFMGSLMQDRSEEKEMALSAEEQESTAGSAEEQESDSGSVEEQESTGDSVKNQELSEDSAEEQESTAGSAEEQESDGGFVEEQASGGQPAEELNNESDSGDDRDFLKDVFSSENLISEDSVSFEDTDEVPIYALANPYTSGRLYYRYGRKGRGDTQEAEDEVPSGENHTENTADFAQRKTVFIGDSRTVGMEMFVGGTENEFWSAKNSMGYSWMVNSGVPDMENLIDENTDVVILMGVNDLGNVYRYVDYMNQKGAEWKARGARTFFVSVTPVLDSKSPNAKNSRIEDFNAYAISNLKDVYYIDAYNRIRDHFGSPDGIHYDTATYREIYRIIHFYLYQGWYEEAGLQFYFDRGRPVTGWHFLDGEWQYMDGSGVRWIKNGRVGEVCLPPYPMAGMMDPDAAILARMFDSGTDVH